jgi:hypothetical protein
MGLITEIRIRLFGKHVAPPPLRGSPPFVEDEPDLLNDVVDDKRPIDLGINPDTDLVDNEWVGDSSYENISGVCVEIMYRDSKGNEGNRRITCKNLVHAGGISYVGAYCHERGAFRRFRADRIVHVMDIETGEIILNHDFISRFRPNRNQKESLNFGLSVGQYADLRGSLKVLVFMGRCDKDWSELEQDIIEEFIEEYWSLSRHHGKPPIDSLMAEVRRMAPDSEDFVTSLDRIARNPQLAQLVCSACNQIADADGEVTVEEVHWSRLVSRYLVGPDD